jgi:hypothetical protein
MGNKDCIPCPALLLQSFGRFESVQARHADVEHHHTGLESVCKLNRRAATEYHTHI